jgi:AAA+ superfamily predicted ATPase
MDKIIPNVKSKKTKIRITLLKGFSSKSIILSPKNIPLIANIDDMNNSKNDNNLFG